MKDKKKKIIIAFAALFIVVTLLVVLGKIFSGNGDMLYSGTIEARQADISFQTVGRVLKIHADRGCSC